MRKKHCVVWGRVHVVDKTCFSTTKMLQFFWILFITALYSELNRNSWRLLWWFNPILIHNIKLLTIMEKSHLIARTQWCICKCIWHCAQCQSHLNALAPYMVSRFFFLVDIWIFECMLKTIECMDQKYLSSSDIACQWWIQYQVQPKWFFF